MEGIDDGSLRPVDAALATRTRLSNLNAVDMWYRRIAGQSAAEIHDLAARIVDIGGLAA
jgi:hypothetical protein